MVKSVLGVNHKGLRDWVIQRISAVLMGVYVIGLGFYFAFHSDLSFVEWHTLFSQTWVKIMTILVILGMMYHAWIGMWTIFTDYVKPYLIRSILNIVVLFTLSACFIWAILILWSA